VDIDNAVQDAISENSGFHYFCHVESCFDNQKPTIHDKKEQVFKWP